MPEDNVSKVKDRVDIVDLVSSYIKLKKTGVNFKAPCPFHNEKSGSFFVSPERQIWHCFGCSLGGDIFTFVQQIEGVEFPEALRMLALRAGVELTYIKQEDRSKKTVLFDINELASKFYEKQLWESSIGKKAIEYLKKRGLTEKSIKLFRLGYSPDSWDSLFNFLQLTYNSQDIIDVGLIIKKNKPTTYNLQPTTYFDRFRSRIMFPISDAHSQIVGFTGRVFGELAKKEDVGKYVNTPQTLIYDKSSVLYGLDKARLDIRRKGRCIVVEGNTDVIMSHQAGIENVVASSGTALTDGHVRILKRYTDTLDLCFDADSAGKTATERAVVLSLSQGMNVNILGDPFASDIKDPADYVNVNGDKAWQEYVNKVKPFLEYFFDTLRKTYDITSAQGKKIFAQKFLPMVSSVSNKVEQAYWVSETANILKIKDDILFSELAGARPITQVVDTQQRVQKVAENLENNTERFDIFEETMLGMIIRQPKLRTYLTKKDYTYLSEPFTLIIGHLKQASKDSVSKDVLDVFLKEFSMLGNMSVDFAYLKSQEMWQDFNDNALEGEFKKLLNYVKKRKIVNQLEQLEYDIKLAENEQDQIKLDKLLKKFTIISDQIHQYHL